MIHSQAEKNTVYNVHIAIFTCLCVTFYVLFKSNGLDEAIWESVVLRGCAEPWHTPPRRGPVVARVARK